jgi:hypothetical protein
VIRRRSRRASATIGVRDVGQPEEAVAEYQFVTAWRIDAPIDEVFGAIRDSLSWPEWWDAVPAVEDVAPGDADGIGNVRRYTFKGRLPYLLRFDLTTDVIAPPERLGGTAVGELEGRGDWLLRPSGDGTLVRYDWQIRTNRWWMNALAPFPFVRSIFELNHDFVMARGLVGLRRRLGATGEAIPPEGIPLDAVATSGEPEPEPQPVG